MIYRQKIGIGLSTRPPSRLLSKCRPDQQDSMAVVGLYLFPINIDMSRLPEYHQMFWRLFVFLKTKIRFDMSIRTIRSRFHSAFTLFTPVMVDEVSIPDLPHGDG